MVIYGYGLAKKKTKPSTAIILSLLVSPNNRFPKNMKPTRYLLPGDKQQSTCGGDCGSTPPTAVSKRRHLCSSQVSSCCQYSVGLAS